MKLAVVGSRAWTNQKMIDDILDEAIDQIDEIISGGAKGADTMAVNWAKKNDIPFRELKANWRPDGKTFDKGAGFKRNGDIVKSCDKMLVFWDGVSKGTKNSVDHAVRLGKPYLVVLDETQLTTPKDVVA